MRPQTKISSRNREKTSSVHLPWRFELDASMKRALTAESNMRVGVDHPNYQTTSDPVAPHSAATRL
jgi:hypothetical protein